MIIPSRPKRISLPATISGRLEPNAELYGAVLATIASFEPWLEDNKLAFFPGYTDHGPDHIYSVIATASALISPDSWPEVSDADCALLVVGTLLHDCAMHISEDGFERLLAEPSPGVDGFDTRPWLLEWQSFLSEAMRWDGRKLKSIFGDAARISPPSLDPLHMNQRDRLLIGEFVRRHHPRMAHEIALFGAPGPDGRQPIVQGLDDELRNLAGLLARSHGMSIRAAVDHLPPAERREVRRIHVPYLMAVLRIADYIQIDDRRAPAELLRIRRLRSPVSMSEWDAHAAVTDLTLTHDDPEALHIRASPKTAASYLKLTKLFASIQSELDESWGVLGEVYGRIPGLNSLALSIRRIRSNLDDVAAFDKTAAYVPVAACFDTAGADLLKLLIEPLYGNKPEIAVRELLQNAVDAVIERNDVSERRGLKPARNDRVVTISVSPLTGNVVGLEVDDNGVGMTVSTVVNYFLRAGASFRNSDQWRTLHAHAEGRSRILRSGRFGIGILTAFLLGDNLEVSTRHIDDPVGIEFSSTIDDDVIELRKIARPPGTTIRIDLRPEVAKELLESPRKWDWFNLASPLVVRRVAAKDLTQARIWPDAGTELPPEWRRIRPRDFTEVHWSYWIPSGIYDEKLVCNGITVYEGFSFMRANTRATTLYSGGGRRLSIRMPHVSVFDPDGALPLNLQRSGLRTDGYPFQQDLCDSVATDFVAFIHASAPVEPTDIFGAESFEYPGVSVEGIGAPQIWNWYWFTPGGWSFLDEDTLGEIAPSRLVVTFDRSTAVALQAIDFARDHVIPMRSSEGTRDSNAWLRLVMGRAGAMVGPLASLQVRGSIVVLPKKWFDQVSLGGGVARDMFQEVKKEEHNGWIILRNRSTEAAKLDIGAVVNQEPVGRRSAVAELFIEGVTGGGSRKEHPLTKIWRTLVPTLAVAYDPVTRARTRPAELDPLFSAHRLMAETRKKRPFVLPSIPENENTDE